MELEMHQLDLRYQDLRRRDPKRERQLLASLAESGQQLPIVVVLAEAPIVIDGYKRVRALKRLARDTVAAMAWDVGEAEALLLERLMRTGGEDALEQAWLLMELHQRFGLAGEELARRFDRSPSWVSRRLALVRELPEAIQQQVRNGAIGAHAAMKCLVPMARANPAAAIRLSAALAGLKPSSRQVEQLYRAWQVGDAQARALIETTPQVYWRACEAVSEDADAPADPLDKVRRDLAALSGIARRVRRALVQGLWPTLAEEARTGLAGSFDVARADCQALFARFAQETGDAR